MLVRLAQSKKSQALSLLKAVQSNRSQCPCHSHGHVHRPSSSVSSSTDYAFEMASSRIRFGRGCTAEIGHDILSLLPRRGRVLIVTDRKVSKLPVLSTIFESIGAVRNTNHIESVHVFSNVEIEPKEKSVRKAAEFGISVMPDLIVAVGGGSVIDTAKIINLLLPSIGSEKPTEADLLDFIPPPLGKGLVVPGDRRPLIAIPTTAGTGSETTGTAIFDLSHPTLKVKTGVADRNLRPTLGICDANNMDSMPRSIRASTGLDVLCHALESWTAIPYTSRSPRPLTPSLRPAYQGSNPISDIFALHAIRSTATHLPRTISQSDNTEAVDQMVLAATLAGIGFGNAGVHLCHGLSYPISSMVSHTTHYTHTDYPVRSSMVPHGVAVAITAPAVFRFTASSNPSRHRDVIEAMGVDLRARSRPVLDEDVGDVLADTLIEFLSKLGDQPMGLSSLGITLKDIPTLVDGAVPQTRVLKLAPALAHQIDTQRDQLDQILRQSLSY